MKILHSYIELGLQKDILDEYHMFDFSKNIEDHHFIYDEYIRLSKIYINRIFLHNDKENNIYLCKEKIKTDWSPFYKYISSHSKDNDIIIKCDDDILFIDIYNLKNAIIDRIKDKESFIIHSNCINNGVCTYYQSELFDNVKDHLKIYPKGGILGILFENPKIANIIHHQFTKDILLSYNNIDKYIIENKYINTRISINFILMNGSDMKYLKDTSYHDEYELSSLFPETLCRYNKINGSLITSHLSYSLQDKIILNNNNIINNYSKIRDMYIKLKDISPIKYKEIYNETLLTSHITNDIYKVKNWIKDNHYYIKNIETNQYLYIDYEIDELELSSNDKTMFQINNIIDNVISIQLGIYYLTKYNSISKFRNELTLIKCYNNNNEKYMVKEDIDENGSFFLKFIKYNNYFTVKNNKKSKWQFEKIICKDEYVYMTRYNKNNKFYYKNIENNEVYTNYYMGWGLENILW